MGVALAVECTVACMAKATADRMPFQPWWVSTWCLLCKLREAMRLCTVWCAHSTIALAWGFCVVRFLQVIPYSSYRVHDVFCWLGVSGNPSAIKHFHDDVRWQAREFLDFKPTSDRINHGQAMKDGFFAFGTNSVRTNEIYAQAFPWYGFHTFGW